jgi:recombination protein RecA
VDLVPGGTGAPEAANPWSLARLTGRLVELSGDGESSSLTIASGMILEAQRQGEVVAWITERQRLFFPPDVAAGGVDLDALPVVRVSAATQLARAADHLARSGAFGLIVVDLGRATSLTIPIQSRLLGLAQKHQTAILFLTEKRREAPSLGSLISLRAQAGRRKSGFDRFTCELTVTKDKRHAPGWKHEEICRGPAGLH